MKMTERNKKSDEKYTKEFWNTKYLKENLSFVEFDENDKDKRLIDASLYFKNTDNLDNYITRIDFHPISHPNVKDRKVHALHLHVKNSRNLFILNLPPIRETMRAFATFGVDIKYLMKNHVTEIIDKND